MNMANTCMRIVVLLWSLACCATQAAGFVGENSISAIHQRECAGDKGLEIILEAPHKNPDGCNDLLVIDVACSSANFQSILSISLSALAANKKVDYWVSGCDANGQAKVITAMIKK